MDIIQPVQEFSYSLTVVFCLFLLSFCLQFSTAVQGYRRTIIDWKALGRDCTNNNGLILQIGVLSS